MRRAPRLLPQYVTGQWYPTLALPRSTSSPTLSRLRLTPFDNHRTANFDRIASEVTTAGAGATLRWVIYADDGRGYPSALVLDTGAVGDASTVGVKEATVSVTLANRRYWLGCIVQGVDASLRVYNGADAPHIGIPQSSLAGATGALGYFTSGVTGAAPTTFPAAAASTSLSPVVFLRKS